MFETYGGISTNLQFSKIVVTEYIPEGGQRLLKNLLLCAQRTEVCTASSFFVKSFEVESRDNRFARSGCGDDKVAAAAVQTPVLVPGLRVSAPGTGWGRKSKNTVG